MIKKFNNQLNSKNFNNKKKNKEINYIKITHNN